MSSTMGVYSALSAGEIRLLKLEPGEGSASIDCSLIATPLGGSTPYQAMSYAWGLLPPTHSINIQNGETRSAFPITKHLFDALCRFRRPHTPVSLWIDAIRIDQGNLPEKNYQVSCMTDVYASAESVYIWLGESDDTSDVAMDFVPEILARHGVIYQSVHKQKRHALNQLLTRSWFSRRWVIQELAFAKDASIFCGSKCLSWRDFADAVTMYSAIGEDIAGLRNNEVISRLGAHGLIYASSNLFRRNYNREILSRLVSLETLLQRLIQFQATEPRDIIYAIMALGKDTYTTDKIKVDYEKPLWEVYRDAISLIICQRESLNIICIPWAPKQIGLPSWITTSEASPFTMSQDGSFIRQNADLLVGERGPSPYQACGKSTARTAKYDFLLQTRPSPKLLADGFILDEVQTCGDTAIDGVVPWNWLEIGGWEDIRNQSPPDAFWRTLVADRDGEGNNPPTWYQRICQEIFQHNGSSCGLDLKSIPETIETSHITREFVRRVQAVVWNRRFMRTAVNQSRGLVPSKAQEGDLICIMAGCSVPLVMRRIDNATHSNSQTGSREALATDIDRVSTRPLGAKMELYFKKLRKIYEIQGGIWDDGLSEDDIFFDDDDSEKKSLDRYVNKPPLLSTNQAEEQSLSRTDAFNDDDGDDYDDNEADTTEALNGDAAEKVNNATRDIRRIDFECTLIGECYMCAAMNGEAMELTHSGGIEMIKFGIS